MLDVPFYLHIAYDMVPITLRLLSINFSGLDLLEPYGETLCLLWELASVCNELFYVLPFNLAKKVVTILDAAVASVQELAHLMLGVLFLILEAYVVEDLGVLIDRVAVVGALSFVGGGLFLSDSLHDGESDLVLLNLRLVLSLFFVEAVIGELAAFVVFFIEGDTFFE